MDEYIAFCGVNCKECRDYNISVCPGCRKSEDGCMPVECCKSKGISVCGECSDFPCEDMKEFYRESQSHSEAYERMCAIKQKD